VRSARAQVRATGRTPVSAKAGANLSPPLVFEARLRSGELEVVARGTRSIYTPLTAEVTATADANLLNADLERMTLENERLENVWGKHITRIVLRPKQPARTGTGTLRLALVP
jgi:hypothetical protein